MPREEFVEYVKENHTAESNINEELVAKTIDFAGDDLERKEEIAATVADNFTKKEIGKMTEQGDVNVIHGEKVVNRLEADGAHSDRTKDESTKIQLDDDADKTAITHEFVHLLRSEDKARKGVARTVYDQDKNGYDVGKKEKDLKFAEECAVIAETEIRTKEPTERPNSNLSNIEWQRIPEKEKKDSYLIERGTMRTKANSIKSNENLPIMKRPGNEDVMKDGNNLRGQKAIQMFERNFKRSRLGNATYVKQSGEKTNVQVICERNKKKEEQNE